MILSSARIVISKVISLLIVLQLSAHIVTNRIMFWGAVLLDHLAHYGNPRNQGAYLKLIPHLLLLLPPPWMILSSTRFLLTTFQELLKQVIPSNFPNLAVTLGNSWLLDSASCNHMIFDNSLLSSSTHVSSLPPIHATNGKLCVYFSY